MGCLLCRSELSRGASELFTHTLTGLLESAVRSTSAQVEEPEVLRRLEVLLLEASPGDTGWDLFSLNYRLDGPLVTLFGHNLTPYLQAFSFLWRSKRIEFVLARLWRSQMTYARLLRDLPGTSSCTVQ